MTDRLFDLLKADRVDRLAARLPAARLPRTPNTRPCGGFSFRRERDSPAGA